MPEQPITTNDKPTMELKLTSTPGEDELRAQAVKQVERVRHFKLHLVASFLGMLVLTAIWAISEYHNAGGWPTDGFSQSSSIPHVWNDWIIWPWIAWAFFISVRAYVAFKHRPASEAEIQREMDRIKATH
jgi:2TM domain-containing protein